jgi:hypothetical protein
MAKAHALATITRTTTTTEEDVHTTAGTIEIVPAMMTDTITITAVTHMIGTKTATPPASIMIEEAQLHHHVGDDGSGAKSMGIVPHPTLMPPALLENACIKTRMMINIIIMHPPTRMVQSQCTRLSLLLSRPVSHPGRELQLRQFPQAHRKSWMMNLNETFGSRQWRILQHGVANRPHK